MQIQHILLYKTNMLQLTFDMGKLVSIFLCFF